MIRVNKIIHSEKTFAGLMAALLALLPLPYGFSTAALILLLTISLYSLKDHKPDLNKAYFIPMAFYMLMVVSVIWSNDRAEAFRGLERQLALVLIPLAFVMMPKLSRNIRNKVFYWFSQALAVFALFFMLKAGFTYLQLGDSAIFFYHELVAPLDLNAIYVSVFVALSCVFLMFEQKKNKRSIATLIILGLFLILLSSKAIILSLTLLIAVGVIRRFNKRTAFILFALLGLGIVLILFTRNPIKDRFQVEITASNLDEVFNKEEFGKVYYWTGTTIRLFQARIFLEMLEEDKLLFKGYGINNSQPVIAKKHREYDLYKEFHNYNFHNQYIQAFAELGLFGLLFLFLMLAVILRQYIITNDILWLALFFIMFVVFLTESYLWRQRGLYHFLLLYCILFKTAMNHKTEIIKEQ